MKLQAIMQRDNTNKIYGKSWNEGIWIRQIYHIDKNVAHLSIWIKERLMKTRIDLKNRFKGSAGRIRIFQFVQWQTNAKPVRGFVAQIISDALWLIQNVSDSLATTCLQSVYQSSAAICLFIPSPCIRLSSRLNLPAIRHDGRAHILHLRVETEMPSMSWDVSVTSLCFEFWVLHVIRFFLSYSFLGSSACVLERRMSWLSIRHCLLYRSTDFF